MNGSGTLTHPSGAIYTGLFRDNVYHGKGIYKFPDGTEYNGTFNNNRCYAMMLSIEYYSNLSNQLQVPILNKCQHCSCFSD